MTAFFFVSFILIQLISVEFQVLIILPFYSILKLLFIKNDHKSKSIVKL